MRTGPKTTLALAAVLMVTLGILAMSGFQRLVRYCGGDFASAPEAAEWFLSPAAKKLVTAAYADLPDKAAVQDHWVQLVSLGNGGDAKLDNRSFVNRDFLSWWHPAQHVRAEVLLSAAGISAPAHADIQYLARLLRLARSLPAHTKLHVAAIDKVYTRDGHPRPHATTMFVDNNYLWQLAQRYPKRIVAMVSVNPYRPQAVAALKKWAGRGVKAVAWMPVLQHIDPADPKLKPYYRALVKNGLTLVTHIGEGLGGGNPAYGNPWRYKHALDAGVHIVMIGCARGGRFPDPDQDRAKVSAAELFVRLLRNPEYAGRLRGALGAIGNAAHSAGALETLLQNPQIFDHLVYASAYPLPAVHATLNIVALASAGFLTQAQLPRLRELYAVNPLLFDFVLKRLLRLPHTDLGLPVSVFTRGVHKAG